MIKSIIYLCIFNFILSASITAISTDYGDSIRVRKYHTNGELKSTGIKINKFKDGKWKHFDKDGYLEKVEIYKKGRKVKTLSIGDTK